MKDLVVSDSSGSKDQRQIIIYDNSRCFFCHFSLNLFTVRTENTVEALKRAVEMPQNQVGLLLTRSNYAMLPVMLM